MLQNSSDFHQVLQQLRPSPGNGSDANTDTPNAGAASADTTAPACSDLAPALRNFSAAAIAGTNRSSTAGSAEANLLAGVTANSQQSAVTNVSPGAKITQQNTVGKNSIGANQDAKEAVAAGTPKTEKARTKSAAANSSPLLSSPLQPPPLPERFFQRASRGGKGSAIHQPATLGCDS